MPQIANQDYKIIAPTPGRNLQNDAAALGELKKSILNGTVFGCLLKDSLANKGDLGRVVGCYPDGSAVGYNSMGNETIYYMPLPYTQAQYQALSIIQRGVDAVDGAIVENLPELIINTYGLLDEGGYGAQIATPEGYRFEATVENGKLATLSVSSVKVPEGFRYCQITFEDALNLIGLPISE